MKGTTTEKLSNQKRHKRDFQEQWESELYDTGQTTGGLMTNFSRAVEENLQSLTYCRFGAYHQNRTLKHVIKGLTLNARTILIHAKRLCTEAISTMICTYAVKAYVEWINQLDIWKYGKTCEEHFTGVKNRVLPDDFHT